MSPSATTVSPAFRRLAASNVAAQLSEQIALAAAPLAAVLLLSAGPSETGLLQTAQSLPFLILSIPAGLFVDRASRRGLMVVSEILRAVSLMAVLALAVSGSLDLVRLAALGFLGAIGTVCYSVAAPALVPTLVPRERLGDANRWLELGRSLAFAGGPALGGVLVGWIGASLAYGVATALSLAAVLCLAGLPPEPRVASEPRRLATDLRDGAAFVLGHRLLRPILVTATFFNAAWFVLQAVYVAYAVDRLGLTASQVGLTLGLYGFGMVVGALLASRLAARIPLGGMILVGPACGLAAAILMVATTWMPSGLLAGASFALFGAGPILWTIATTTLRQAVTPNAMLGRVSALIATATYGARPAGAAIGAFVATRLGVEACLMISALGFLVQFVVIATSSVPRLRTLPGAPSFIRDEDVADPSRLQSIKNTMKI